MEPAVQAIIVVGAAFFGAAVGSFLNVCIYRLPREGLSVTKPARSFCPTCGDPVGGLDNIPIVSWILLAGRCRTCKAPISSRYLLVEALTAMFFVVVVHRYLLAEAPGSWGGCLTLLLVVSGLIVATFIDVDLRLIPDEITIGGMHIVPFAVLLFPDLHTRCVDPSLMSLLTFLEPVFRDVHGTVPAVFSGDAAMVTGVGAVSLSAFAVASFGYRLYRRRFLSDLPNRFRDVSLAGVIGAVVAGLLTVHFLRPDLTFAPGVYALWATLVGMLVGSGLVFLVGAIGSRVFRKPAMGFGDVKLMGLLGAVAGWKGALAGFFIACFLGAVVGVVRLWLYRDRYLPFGPFLAIGCLFLALWPDAFERLLQWYLGLFG